MRSLSDIFRNFLQLEYVTDEIDAAAAYLESSMGTLKVVGRWCRAVGAARRGRPDGGVGSRLGDVPAGCLLGPVVAAALGVEIALAGGAVGVGDRVVEVAVEGLGVAGRGGAQLVAGADQMPELAAGDVAALGALVVARVPRERFERNVQPLEEVE
jgi:hypothetical protein